MFGRIYGIENLLDHKIYVGQTHRKVEKRFNEHKRSKKSYIGRAIRKYGIENFIVVILEECENQEELDACEIKWIAKLNCQYPNGYNYHKGGLGGHIDSEETRTKLANCAKGKIPWNKGKKLSQEIRDKLSAAKKGRKRFPHTEETKMKISMANKGQVPWVKGRKLSDQTKAKISASLMGNPVPAEVREKISKTLTGRKLK